MIIPYPSSVSPDTVVEFLPYEPLQVNPVPEGLVAKQVACGGGHRLALLEDGSVVGWGANGYGQCDPPPGLVATQIAAGNASSIAIREDGRVVEWGRWIGAGFSGQTPLAVMPEGLVATQITHSGNEHALAIREDGSVVGWGANGYGQCNPPPGLVATQIAAAIHCSFAIREDGTVVGWGGNSNLQESMPSPLVATQIAARADKALVLKPDGSTAYYGYRCPRTYPGNDVVQIDNMGAGGILLLNNKEVVCTTRYITGYALDPWFVPGLKASQVAIGGEFALAIGSFEDDRPSRRKRAAWAAMERPLFL